MDEKTYRQFDRVQTNSVIVSLTGSALVQPITGFLRDISEGGMKIQRIAETKLELAEYESQFFLPGIGKLVIPVQVVGFGEEHEKFSARIVRMRFMKLDKQTKEKIRQYIGTLQEV